MPTETAAFVNYCISIAQEFNSRLSRMRVFVKHNLSSGTANEAILRDFLSNHAQGFICDPLRENTVSKQCDVLIYQQNRYPLVYSEGPVKVVWPEAVRMTIEVKTNFGPKDIKPAIENASAAMEISIDLTSVIFAFESPSLGTVLNNLASYDEQIPDNHLPTAILLLDKGVIIHRWGWARRDDVNIEDRTYAVHKGKNEKEGIVVTFLLLLFFQAVDLGFLEANFINALNTVLEELTEKLPDTRIGQ
jgi:hypothetical protein